MRNRTCKQYDLCYMPNLHEILSLLENLIFSLDFRGIYQYEAWEEEHPTGEC